MKLKYQIGGKLIRNVNTIPNLIQNRQNTMPLFFKGKNNLGFVPRKETQPIQRNYKGEPFIDSLDDEISFRNNYNKSQSYDSDIINSPNKNNPIKLPEVIKIPSNKDVKTKQYIQQLVPNKNYRDDLYKSASYLNLKDSQNNLNNKSVYISDNDYALRLARLYKAAGSPNINRLSIQEGEYAKKGRAYMHHSYISNDDLYINTPEDLIGELSHSYGFKQGATPTINSKIDQLIYGNSDNYYIKGKTGYSNPRHYEYQTHKVVEPNLYNFLRGNTKGMDIKNLNDKINQIKEQRIERFGTSLGQYLLDSALSSKENKLNSNESNSISRQ